MNEQTYPIFGSCLCASIKYQVDKLEPKMGHCHCTMCRKFHGAAYSTFGEAKSEHFHWLKGKELLKEYTAENGSVRQFCSKCGSSMTFSDNKDSSDSVEFTLGTLDSEITHRPDAHIYVESKPSWSSINDHLPLFKQSRK